MAKYRISYWTFIFAITFCFQIFRAKFSDAIIFGLATVIMLLQPIHQIRNFSLPRLKMDRRTIWFLVSFLGLAIAYIPRHHQLLAAIFLALAALLFLTLWNFQDEHQSFTRLEIKSAYFWGSTAVAVSL